MKSYGLSLQSDMVNHCHRKDTQALKQTWEEWERSSINFYCCLFFFLCSLPKNDPPPSTPRGKTITTSKQKQFCSAVGLIEDYIYVTMLNGNYFVKIVGLIYFDLLAIKRSTETQNGIQVRKYFHEESTDRSISINKSHNITNI